MTWFEIIVPILALAVAGGGILVLRATDKGDGQHPAE